MRKIYYPATLVIVFFIFFGIDSVFLHRYFRVSNEEVVVRINKGDNLRSVSARFEQSGVIFSKVLFMAAGRLLGYQDKLIPGEYKFLNGLTMLDVLMRITDPNISRFITVTIPEGLNIRQIGRLLSRQLGLDSAKFVNAAFNDSLISLLDIKAENLEGFLFPDTYEIDLSNNSNSEEKIVLMMFNQFRRKIEKKLTEKIKVSRKNMFEIITMASIVEAETRYEAEKKTIAAVYYNRLNKHMKLEADPTVQYALPDGPKKRLTYTDLKYDSPYNTYKYRGLPPGPINNPGYSSIIAVLEPEKHRYLYFVAKGDGSHRFAETFEEHKKNIEEYRKYLNEQEKNSNNKK
jgi:UPF0755 protein